MGPAVLVPVEGARVWRGPQMAVRSDEWTYQLSAEEIAELDAAVADIDSRALGLLHITREGFPLPVLGKNLRCIQDDLHNGVGFAVLRGVPVERYDIRRAAIAYFGIGAHLGEAVSQNARVTRSAMFATSASIQAFRRRAVTRARTS